VTAQRGTGTVPRRTQNLQREILVADAPGDGDAADTECQCRECPLATHALRQVGVDVRLELADELLDPARVGGRRRGHRARQIRT